MLQPDGLAEAADDLRCRGIDANYVLLYGPLGAVEGLEVAEDFFPLWELILPENQDAFDRLDFAAIKNRRCPEWSPHSLHPARSAAG